MRLGLGGEAEHSTAESILTDTQRKCIVCMYPPMCVCLWVAIDNLRYGVLPYVRNWVCMSACVCMHLSHVSIQNSEAS